MTAKKKAWRRGDGPSLRQHRNGQWTIRLRKRDYYFGTDLEVAKRRRLELLLADARGELPGKKPRIPKPGPDGIMVCELIDAYVQAFCARKPEYRTADGKPAAHGQNVTIELSELKGRFGHKPSKLLERTDLVMLRDAMLEDGLARATINSKIRRAKEILRWGSERGLVPESVWTAMLPLKNLSAAECPRKRVVEAVPEADVAKTLPFLSAENACAVRLLLATGARSGEILGIRRKDIEMREDGLWIIHVRQHKTAWRGHERRLYLLARDQPILRPMMKLDPEAPTFTVSTNTLGHAVKRACKKAGVPRWHLHQLRHTAASRIERIHGPTVARVLLGHRSLTMTSRYVHPDETLAIQRLQSAQE